MRINNFKELEREEIENIKPSIDRIKSNVNSNLGIFQFLGEIVELFLPRLFNMFINLSGNNRGDRDTTDNHGNRYPNT